jgi:hypothetical protein
VSPIKGVFAAIFAPFPAFKPVEIWYLLIRMLNDKWMGNDAAEFVIHLGIGFGRGHGHSHGGFLLIG